MSDRYAVSARVAWVDAEELGHDALEVYLTLVPEGPPMVLAGPAWAVWTAVADQAEDPGTEEDVVTRVSALTGLRPEEVAADVRSFLRSLVDAGLVSPQRSLEA